MSFFQFSSEGSAWLKSVIDPRWNTNITCSVGGFEMPVELKERIIAMEKLYGDRPEDLEWGYEKY